jgi:hypothetical protein
MTNKMNLKWGIDRPPPLNDSRGGNQDQPSWRLVEFMLGSVEDFGGSMTLTFLKQPDVGPGSLQVAAEKGKYLLTLLEHTKGKSIVRDFTNPDAKDEMVGLRGNLWHASMICTDFTLVRRAFKDFFETGDVSYQILDRIDADGN